MYIFIFLYAVVSCWLLLIRCISWASDCVQKLHWDAFEGSVRPLMMTIAAAE